MPAAWPIFASYVLLALGMGIVVFDVVATMLSAVPDKRSLDSWAAFFRDLPIASFAAFAGLFIAVPGLLAALRMFWAALPWSNPAFGSLAAGLGTLFFGGLIAFLLLQEQLAPMLHNTFVVPAYIHPIAAGGANLTYMGALYFGVPALMHRRLWGLRIARWQPYVMGGMHDATAAPTAVP